MVSLPILIKVISTTMRLTVAIKIPEVDDMKARAQEKVDAIKQAKQKVGELRPIDEVVFAQNSPQVQSRVGTFTKWKGDELSCNVGMSVHARVTAKR